LTARLVPDATTGGGIPMEVPGTGWLHHMNLVTVRDERISLTTIPVGAVMDPKELTPERLAEIDQVRRLPLTALAAPLPVKMDGSSDGEAKFRLTNPTTRSIEVNLNCTAGGGWTAGPDHVHMTIEGGKSSEASLRFRRKADGFEGEFKEAEVPVQVDYLGETQRVSLPEIGQPIAVRPVGIRIDDLPPAEDRAIVVDGEGASLRVASEMIEIPQGPFTVEARIRPATLEGVQAVVGKTEASEFTLFLDKGRPAFYVWIGGAYAIAMAEKETVSVEKWCHLAGVYDGKEVRVLLDGRVVGRREAVGERKRNAMPLYVGRHAIRVGAVEQASAKE
jgi:hypothetical protein